MNASERQFTTELKSELLYLQNEIKKFKHAHQEFDSGMLDLLKLIAEHLNDEQLGPATLKEDAFGIFRLITDNFALEESDVGKNLMEFRLKLRRLASMLDENR